MCSIAAPSLPASILEVRPKSLALETRWDEVSGAAPLGRVFRPRLAEYQLGVERQAPCSSTAVCRCHFSAGPLAIPVPDRQASSPGCLQMILRGLNRMVVGDGRTPLAGELPQELHYAPA